MKNRKFILGAFLIISVFLFSFSIVSAQCTDSDGGLNYGIKGNVSNFTLDKTINEKSLEFEEGLVIHSETTATLKINNIQREVVVGNSYYFGYEKVLVNDIDLFGVGDSRNEIEISVVGSTDVCVDKNFLKEWFCEPDRIIEYDNYYCQNGCSDGACIGQGDSNCTDSDGGLNYFEKGELTVDGNIYEDVCTDSNFVKEYFCDNPPNYYDNYYCQNGCSNGECIGEEEPVAGLRDVINEQITCYFVNPTQAEWCIANINQERFNCEWYPTKGLDRYGNGNCTIEVYGEKGQKLNWKSSCYGWDYSVIDGINNNVDFDCSKSVNVSEEGVEFIIPEEEPIEIPVEEIPEGNVFCSGCVLEGKCYPFGYRIKEDYCSGSTESFENQKIGDASCDNNFECESNLCVSGKCLSQSIIQKIINWFKNIFG